MKSKTLVDRLWLGKVIKVKSVKKKKKMIYPKLVAQVVLDPRDYFDGKPIKSCQ